MFADITGSKCFELTLIARGKIVQFPLIVNKGEK